MPYRKKLDAPAGTGDLVTIRRYLDPMHAQLAKTTLSAHGIEAYVFEAASFNPMLSGVVGGARLEVRTGDVEQAEKLLHDDPAERSLAEADAGGTDGEEAGVIRCPRCELAYCFHERVRTEGQSAATAFAFVGALFVAFMPKRWHCHKCGHVWDDPKEGPAAMTPLPPGEPRPVFRLRRAHAGMGVFLGLIAGTLAMIVLPKIGLLLFAGAVLVGWAVGRSMRYDVCSEPSCRMVLPSDREECPRCNGLIAGAVRSAEEHYVAAAIFRRDLHALAARDGAGAQKKGGKAKKKGAARRESLGG